MKVRRTAPRTMLAVWWAMVVALGAACGPGGGDPAVLTAKSLNVMYQSLQRQTTETVPVADTRSVRKGDGVDVDDQGEGWLSFRDDLLVKIYRASTLTLEGSVSPTASPLSRYRLKAGTTFNKVTPQQRAEQRVRLNVITGSAEVTATGTEFLVHVKADTQATWVVAGEGEVKVSGAGKEVTLTQGQQTWVDPGQPPADPVAASRAAVGNRFESLEQLTNGSLTDAGILTGVSSPTPVPSPTPTPAPSPRPTAVPATATPTATSTLNPTVGGDPALLSLKLEPPAGAGGEVATLTSSDPRVAVVPGTLMFAAGATGRVVEILTRPVMQPTRVTITIESPGGTRVTTSHALTVLPRPSGSPYFSVIEATPRPVYYGACGAEPTELRVRTELTSVADVARVALVYEYLRDVNTLAQPNPLAMRRQPDGRFAVAIDVAKEAPATATGIVFKLIGLDQAGEATVESGERFAPLERCRGAPAPASPAPTATRSGQATPP